MIKIRPWSLIGLVQDLIRLKRHLETSEHAGVAMFRNGITGELVIVDGVVDMVEFGLPNGLEPMGMADDSFHTRCVNDHHPNLRLRLVVPVEYGEMLVSTFHPYEKVNDGE